MIDSTSGPRSGALVVPLLSACAAILGAVVGSAGTYLATKEQIDSQALLERRESIGAACSSLYAGTIRIRAVAGGGTDLLRVVAESGEGDPLSLQRQMEEEATVLAQQHANLSLVASQRTTAASQDVMDQMDKIVDMAGDVSVIGLIGAIGDGRDPDLSQSLGRISFLMPDLTQELINRARTLSGICRDDIEDGGTL